MRWKETEMAWREVEKLSRLTYARFQEIESPPEAPEESMDMDWLPHQSMDIRGSMLELLVLVSCKHEDGGVFLLNLFLDHSVLAGTIDASNIPRYCLH